MPLVASSLHVVPGGRLPITSKSPVGVEPLTCVGAGSPVARPRHVMGERAYRPVSAS
jgi:hypothetical protein